MHQNQIIPSSLFYFELLNFFNDKSIKEVDALSSKILIFIAIYFPVK